MTNDKLAQRLSNYVDYETNMTRNAFAAKAGIDPANFSKMLAGKQKITTNTLKKISAAHGVSMTWLLTGEGDMLNQSPAIDVDLNLRLDGGSQLAMRDITNIGDAKTQLALLHERIKSLESELDEKNKRLAELTASLDRERKLNDYLISKK